MNRGFVIVAQNTDNVNYVNCARLLAWSIKNNMPGESVTLITDKPIDAKIFNHIVLLPHGDFCEGSQWKLANDWQVYDASPYDYTIKIEADFFLSRSISHWWDRLKTRDLNICTTIRNYHNNVSTSRYYRKFIDDNKLPDTYNGLTYFKKSTTANNFFNIVRNIFENWHEYKSIVKCPSYEQATTDFVYAIAAEIIGRENCIMPNFTDFSFIHMKKHIIDTVSNDWTDDLIHEVSKNFFRINTVPSMYPVHYHIKTFAKTLWKDINEF